MNILQQARRYGNPIVDGSTVTFVWEGRKAAHLMDDLHGWDEDSQPLTRSAPGVWTTSFDLPRDAYLEYAFYDPKAKKRHLDPLNRKSVSNGFGSHNNYFYMPEADGPTPLAHMPRAGLRGKVSRHTIDAGQFTVSTQRRVYLYHPPARHRVPLLVVYDGLDYFRRARLVEVVDNLIAQDRIRPVALALLQNAGEGGRVVEYGCSEPTLAFVTRCVLPLARQQIRLLDHRENPGAHAILGASMGGLMAVFTAMSLPQIFGRALSQAGAFEIWEYETLPMRMARHFPRPAIKIWMSCGQMDFLLECNRKMHSVLREKDYEVSYVESGGAHNYTTWRDSLWRGLEELFTV